MSVIVTISLPIWCTKWSCPQHFTREPTFFFSRCPFLARILLQPCFLVYMLPFSFHFGKEIKIYSYGVTFQGLCFPFTPFLSPIFNHPFVVSTLFLILHIVDYISFFLSFLFILLLNVIQVACHVHIILSFSPCQLQIQTLFFLFIMMTFGLR